jgi:hypothetical protein
MKLVYAYKNSYCCASSSPLLFVSWKKWELMLDILNPMHELTF